MSDPRGQILDSRYLHNGRLTLLKWQNAQSAGPTYYYADDLPYAAKLYTVLSVFGSILSTPLVLLCCIPTIKSIKKVHIIYYTLIVHSGCSAH